MARTAEMPATALARTGQGVDRRLGEAGEAAVCVSVRWAIARDALVLAPGGAALLNGHAATLRSCWLCVAVDGIDGSGLAMVRAMLELVDVSGEREVMPMTEAAGVMAVVVCDQTSGCVNVDAPGVLSMTLAGGKQRRLLLARSGLLSGRLGLPGGVYDAPVFAEGLAED